MTLPLIQFVDIKKRFGTNQVLDGINLSIYKGDIMEHDPAAHDRRHSELQEGPAPRGAGGRR